MGEIIVGFALFMFFVFGLYKFTNQCIDSTYDEFKKRKKQRYESDRKWQEYLRSSNYVSQLKSISPVSMPHPSHKPNKQSTSPSKIIEKEGSGEVNIKETELNNYTSTPPSITHEPPKAKKLQKEIPENIPSSKINITHEQNIFKRIPFVSLISVILISLVFGLWASDTDNLLEPAIVAIIAFSILFITNEARLLSNVSKAYKETCADAIQQYEAKINRRLSEREKKIIESEKRCHEILNQNSNILSRNESVLKENQKILLQNSEILAENNIIKTENEHLINIRNENEIAQIRKEYEQIIEQYNITIKELTK